MVPFRSRLFRTYGPGAEDSRAFGALACCRRGCDARLFRTSFRSGGAGAGGPAAGAQRRLLPALPVADSRPAAGCPGRFRYRCPVGNGALRLPGHPCRLDGRNRAGGVRGGAWAGADRHGGDRHRRASGQCPGGPRPYLAGSGAGVGKPRPMAQLPLRAAPEPGVLPERFCRPDRPEGHANRTVPARSGDQRPGRHLVPGRLPDRPDGPAGKPGCPAAAARRAVGHRLPGGDPLDGTAGPAPVGRPMPKERRRSPASPWCGIRKRSAP